jgi:type I restriction enzyme M protein
MASGTNEIEKRLWATADQLRANSNLMPSEYSGPVLGLLFLRYAEKRFAEAEKAIGKVGTPKAGGRRDVTVDDYLRQGIIYLPPQARFGHLLQLPESADLGKALNEAMRFVEDANPDLAGVLPRGYGGVEKRTLVELIRLLGPVEIEGDAFGRVYEYFMGNFAKQSMQKGGEFYTPASLVQLIVEIIEPFHGRILDPACGSGGMFVHSAEFVRRHQKDPDKELSVLGVEKVRETLRMAKLNLAVHGLHGDIREANTYYEDPHEALGRFDFVMANPPFNVDGVDKERLRGDPRFPFGIPGPDNANYLWIQLFYAALNEKGRAGFVMANSAADARGSELEIRRKLIEAGAVDVIVSIGPNFFYTVTLPCTLWFLDRGKPEERKGKVLFIDARHIYRQIDRAHRDFTEAQVEFLANIARLYRGEEPEVLQGSLPLMKEKLGGTRYVDVPGLCKVATIKEIEAQGWSVNPGRYVGVAAGQSEDVDFLERLEALNEELEVLNTEARELENKIASNVAELLEQAA